MYSVGVRVRTLVALLLLTSLASAQKVLKWNIGGPAIPSESYLADPEGIVSPGTSIFNSGKAALGALATHRWTSAKSMSFTFNGLPADGYHVVLGFAEVYSGITGPGQRTFGVNVQNKVIKTNYDIFGLVGANKVKWLNIFDVVVGNNGKLVITITKGAAENPMLSVISIRCNTCPKLELPPNSFVPATNPTSKSTNLSLTGGVDHQAHAVAGEGYVATDLDDDGFVNILLDGTKSHTHLIGGSVTRYEWTFNGKVIGIKAKFVHKFPVGKSIVKLTIWDSADDKASETTEVIALPNSDSGAYCYFYPGATKIGKNINSEPRPSQGVKVENIAWLTTSAFPFLGKSQPTFAVRCTVKLSSGPLAAGALGIRRTGRVVVYGGNTVLINEQNSAGGNGLVTVKSPIAGGMTNLNIVYYKNGPSGALSLEINKTPVASKQLMFSQTDVFPVLKSISPLTGGLKGGEQMQLFGSGFFNGPNVIFFGPKKVVPTAVNKNELSVIVPAATGPGKVKVYVSNKVGQSNNILYTYDSNTVVQPIAFTQTTLKKKQGGIFGIGLITSIGVGPDFNYYMGSQDGFLYKVTAGQNLVVQGSCKSGSFGQARSILGIAFNPWKKAPQPYVSTSTLFRKSSKVNTPLKNKADGWANGQVETLNAGCGCFCMNSKKILISGLPVSHHDHSVNKMAFLPNGDMLITVAGATNGGHNTPGNLLGGLAETPLSSTVLLAKLSKGDNIKGAVKYNQYGNPANSKVLPGSSSDISVYATGLRNSFGITRTWDGRVFATDNGANKGFGLKSTSCTTQVPFTKNIPDELNLIIKGGHYGHANRAQNKCTWGTGIKPVTTFPSSTDGIIEYWSNVFSGNLKGDLIATQYTTTQASFQGSTTRIKVNKAGKVQLQQQLAPYSGVAAENGLYGEIVMPRVGKFQVAVLQPKFNPPAGKPFVIAVAPKWGTKNQLVMVTGAGFGPGLKATLGGLPCAVQAGSITGNSFKCTTPAAGVGLHTMTVTLKGAVSPKSTVPGDFYMIN